MLHPTIWKVTYLGRQSTAKDKQDARKLVDAATRISHPAYRYSLEHIHDNGKILAIHRAYEWSAWRSLRVRLAAVIDSVLSGTQISNA